MKKLLILALFILPNLPIGSQVQLFAQTQMWVARYTGEAGSGGPNDAYAIAVDDSGYIYVTGTSGDTTTGWGDYATIKYNSSGDTVWVKRYTGEGSDNKAHAIALDKKGSVYVTGMSVGKGYDYATIKYNSSGNTVWVRRYNYSSGKYNDDIAYAIAVDDSGNVYVTGASDSGTGKNYDYATIKYNSSGDTVWVRRYNGTGNGADVASAIAVDKNENVYVTGTSLDTNNTCMDYATVKYSSSGDTMWVRRYNKLGYRNNEANAIAVDKKDNVYVTGFSSKSFSTDIISEYATIKYNSSGDTVWVRTYSGMGKRKLSGYKETAKIVSDKEKGNKNGTAYEGATALAIDNSGNVYVTGTSYFGTNDDYATIKYDSLGDTIWVRRYNGTGDSTDYATGIAVDSTGNVYITGYSWGTANVYGEDYATIKYSSSGDLEWVERYDGPGHQEDWAYAIALDNKGYVYVTGGSIGLTEVDYATIKYSCVGIEEQSPVSSKQLAVTANPNPFFGKTILRLEDSRLQIKDYKIQIYDLSGRLVKTTNSNTIGNDLKKGVYFVKVNDNKKLLKIIKLGGVK